MKNIYKLLALGVIISVFSISSCSEDTINENGIGTLKGRVVTAGDNTPLENVKITTSPASTTVFTDFEGNFIIEEISSGEFSVQAELDEYLSSFESVTITDRGTSNVVFELEISTANNRPPDLPILLFPPDNATNINLSVDYLWTVTDPEDDDLTFTLEIRNSTNEEVLVFENLQDTLYSLQDLRLGETYFWQVSASDDINPPVLSNISSFTTIDESSNRFYYVKQVGNNNVIYSGGDQEVDEINFNEYRLTPIDKNSFRPRKNVTANKIAFLRTDGAETHLYSMNPDGTNVFKITSVISVAGFRQDEVDFTWYQNGQRLYYPNLNKLYSVNASGTGNTLVYSAPSGVFITEIATNEFDNLILLKTNDADGYNARIFIINTNGVEQEVVIEGEAGALGGIDFSIDGSKVLYNRDISGSENTFYRQLDSRIFEYNVNDDTTLEIDTSKPEGTNDLDVKYSLDNGAIIYVNTSNDGISQKNIYKFIFEDQPERTFIFSDASMPDWQ